MDLPTKFDVILCDGIREEKRNKLTIFGFFAGDDVVVDKSLALDKINLRLVFIVRFKDGHGKWPASWKVVDPNDDVLSPDVDDIQLEKKVDVNSTVVIEFAGHRVKEYGDHRFVMTVGDRDYEFVYQIRPGEVEK